VQADEEEDENFLNGQVQIAQASNSSGTDDFVNQEDE